MIQLKELSKKELLELDDSCPKCENCMSFNAISENTGLWSYEKYCTVLDDTVIYIIVNCSKFKPKTD